MATAYPPLEDNFELELSRVRERIKVKFKEIIECLKVRERTLLEELDRVLSSYHSYRSEYNKVIEKKRDLEVMKQRNEGELSTTFSKNLKDNILTQINRELETIEIPIEPQMVSFVCDNSLLAEVSKLGELLESARNNSGSKIQPLVIVCEKGSEMQQLYDPQGVAVDNKIGNIYVSDYWNHCVKVFDKSGKFVFRFGGKEGEGKMNYPRGIATFRDRILISNGNVRFNYILNYQLNGKFVSRIGKWGIRETEFA